MPAATQVATVPAAPKSMSSGCAATHRTRVTSVDRRGQRREAHVRDYVRALPRPARPGYSGPRPARRISSASWTPSAPERVAEAVDDLALAGEHEPGATGGDADPADLAGDRGAFPPQAR